MSIKNIYFAILLFLNVLCSGQKKENDGFSIGITSLAYDHNEYTIELSVIFNNRTDSLVSFKLQDYTYTPTEDNYHLSVIANDSLSLYSTNLFGGYPSKPKYKELQAKQSFKFNWKLKLDELNTLKGIVESKDPQIFENYKIQLIYYDKLHKRKNCIRDTIKSNILEIVPPLTAPSL